MKLLLTLLLVFLAQSSLALYPESEESALTTPETAVNLSLDLNSRDLMATALGETENSVSAVVYKFDDPLLLPSLLETIARGVKVQILCDEKESAKSVSLVWDLAKAGAEIKVWPRNQGKLHAKFVLCDNRRVLTGSWNWTKSAGGKNLELLIDIRDDQAVQNFAGLFDRLWAMGQPVKKQPGEHSK